MQSIYTDGGGGGGGIAFDEQHTTSIIKQFVLTSCNHSFSECQRGNMSFLNIKDKRLREQTIEDYLALKKRLKSRYSDENEDDQSYRRDLEEQYEPVVAGQERMTQDITDQLIPIKDQIQQLAALTTPKTEDVEIQTEQPDEEQEEKQ